MNNKFIAIMLSVITSFGLLYAPHAYGHVFGGDESAAFLAKVWELKAEMQGIQSDLSNATLVAWHIDKSSEYWNANDTKEMSERNKLLAQEIPATLSSIYTKANATNPDPAVVKQHIDKLNGYLDEGTSVRIDKNKMQNATVGALTVYYMLKETLEHYADAIGTDMDLNDMSNMKSMSMSSTGGMQSSGMSATPINNTAAYNSAQILAKYAQDFYDNNVRDKAPPDGADSARKISDALMELNQAIANKASANDIMVIVHTKIHPNMMTAFNLQVVPEFPLPMLLVVISFAGFVFMQRMKKIRFNNS